MRRRLVSVTVIARVGCAEEKSPPIPDDSAERTAPSAIEAPSEAERVASMEAHYGSVILAHDALQQSDLETFRAALEVAEEQDLPPGSPPEWVPNHERMEAAAHAGARAADLDGADAAPRPR